MDEKMLLGITGTVMSATGAGLSVTELQAIISIVITVLGFIISVLIPLVIKIVKKVKAAKEDGVITKEEAADILETGKEIKDATESLIKEVSDKKNQKE